MNRYIIEFYKSFEKATFYTIRASNEELSETDNFFLRFKDDPKHTKDVETIKYWISKIGTEYGAQERHFRPERRARAIPIPPPRSRLRLYCLHISEQVVILGNGGKKTSKKVQGSPDAFPHFELMNKLASILTFKRSNKEIIVNGNRLEGNLTLKIK